MRKREVIITLLFVFAAGFHMASWLCFGRGSSRVAYLERLCDILKYI